MKKLNTLAIVLYFACLSLCFGDYHTNTITTPGGSFAFSVDGSPANNPTINLVAGVTNILIINTASFHPVVICNTPVTSDRFSGASPQSVNAQPITVKTTTSGFPSVLYYMCSIHGFSGQINITAPTAPAPPPNTILEVHVGTNIVMTSTGTTTTWQLIPEFSSNLISGVWAAVPGFTNHFAGGTNTTVFARLDPICGLNVFLRIRQQQN